MYDLIHTQRNLSRVRYLVKHFFPMYSCLLDLMAYRLGTLAWRSGLELYRNWEEKQEEKRKEKREEKWGEKREEKREERWKETRGKEMEEKRGGKLVGQRGSNG